MHHNHCVRPRRKEKLGVSEVTGTLITLAIVISSGSMIVYYGLNSLIQGNQAFVFISDTAKDQALERFVVDNVFFNGTTQINVSVFNVGKRTVTIDLMMINDTVVDFVGEEQVSFDSGYRQTLTTSFSVESGKLYVLRVVSTRGVVYESLWKT